MTENNESGKRRGPPKGRRPVVYVCAAVVNGSLVCEDVQVKDQEPESANGSFPKEVAIASFRESHQAEPETVIGPLFQKKGGQKATAGRKRLALDRDNLDQYTLSKEHKKARYGSWNGFVNMCTNDDSKALFVPIDKVDGDSSKKNTPPAAGIVDVANLLFEEATTQENTTV